MLLSRRTGEIVFEAFELSPTNAAVMETAGRLRRTFPDVCNTLTDRQFAKKGFQKMFARSIATLSHQVFPGMTPQTRKAGQMQAESRDTTKPHAVTEMTMAMIQAIGEARVVEGLQKNTREEVLWKDSLAPWRRSPLWLLVRVGVQLLCTRRHVDKASGNQLYKKIMMHFQAELLECNIAVASAEKLHIMNAKLSRRLLKLQPGQDEMAALWLQNARKIMQNAHQRKQELWTRAIDHSRPDWRLSDLRSLDFAADTLISLPELDEFLNRVAARQAQAALNSFNPQETTVRFNSMQLPTISAGFTGDYGPSELAAFHEWISANLQPWLLRGMRDTSTCSNLWRLLNAYNDSALARIGNDPELQSLRVLTIMDLWVACDESACAVLPLLKQYQPEVPSLPLQSLVLTTKAQMLRLDRIERYISQRRRSASVNHPSVFAAFGDKLSFGVRYYAQSTVHQELHRRIEQDAQRARQNKITEFQQKKARHEDLVQQARDLDCQFQTVVINEFHGITEERHASWCRKCNLQSQADSIDIKVDEWPLPKGSDGEATVFELNVPESFAAWREATLFVINDVLKYEHSSDHQPSNQFMPNGYENLRRYFVSSLSGGRRVTALSEDKPWIITHYKAQRIGPAKMVDVCKDNALHYAYCDMTQNTFLKGFTATDRLFDICVYKVTAGLSLMQRFLNRPPSQFKGVTHNEVIASQSQCPDAISLKEFRAFGTVPGGDRLQWLNVLRELAAPGVDFSKPDTRVLILQVIHQAGRPLENTTERTAHAVLRNKDFCFKVMDQLRENLRLVEENWESSDALASFIHIAARILALNPSKDVQIVCLDFLNSARDIALRWMQALQRKVFDSTIDKERCQFTVSAVETALICISTFDVEQSHLENILSGEDGLSKFLQCQMTIHENQLAFEKCQHPLRAVMFHRWEILCSRSWEYVKAQVLISGNTGLDTAVQVSWPEFSRDQAWVAHTSCDHWLIASTTSSDSQKSLQVHFDLLRGRLLVNGTPLARLPSAFEAHPDYGILFGASQIQVRPSGMHGMQFSAKQKFSGYDIDFGIHKTSTSHDMYVRGRKDEQTFEFVPERYLAQHSPAAFGNDYVHWYRISSQTIEFRAKVNPWRSAPVCQLQRSGQLWVMQKSGSFLVAPSSKTALVLAKTLSALDNQAHMHNFYQKSTQGLQIEFPRLRLCFSLQQGSTEIVSRDFRGMCVDTNQDIGALTGLQNKLVLRNLSSLDSRKVLLPYGPVSYQLSKEHVKVTVDDTTREVVHDYLIDRTLGRLIDNGTLESKLYLCYLHALTAHSCTEALSGMTGTEQALSILRSAALRSFDKLTATDMSMLSDIAGLSPARNFYPQHLRTMQSISWDNRLHSLSQHHEFYILTQAIFEQWSSQQMFHADSDVQAPRISTEMHLIERAMIRVAQCYVSDYGAEKFTTDCDKDYTPRPAPRKAGLRAFQTAVSTLSHSQALYDDFASGVAQRLWTKFQDGATTHGAKQPLHQSDLHLSSKWYEDPWKELRRIWLKVHASFLDADKKPNKFTMMMWLSSFAFMHEPHMDAVCVITALYNGLRSSTVTIPSADVYSPQAGTSPNIHDINAVVTAAKRSAQSCASLWNKEANETDAAFRNRRRRDFEKRQASAVKSFANQLLQQWPTLNPTVPDLPDVLRLIDTAAVMRNIVPYFQKWHDNQQLWLYLHNIELALRQWSVKSCPAFKTPSTEIFVPTPAAKRFVCAGEIFLAEAPTIAPFSDKLTTQLNKDTAQLASIDRLDQLLNRLEQTANVLYTREYVAHLRVSMSSLQSWQEVRISDYDFTDVERELREQIQACSQHVRVIFDHLTGVAKANIDEGSSHAWTIDQRPRVSPSFFLRQLVRQRWEGTLQSWKSCLIAYACSLVLLQRLRRLLALHRSPADFVEEFINTPHQSWDPLQFPQYLLLEVESGIVIRSVQEEIAREMKAATTKNVVMQLNMGEGKSSVIVPMVISEIANGSQLARIVVPKPQARQLFQMLSSKLGGLMDKRIYHLPVSRSLKLTEAEARRIGLICRECLSQGGVLLVQPEHILSLKLMALDFLASDKPGAGRAILDVLHLFGSKARDIVDESDENFNVKFELVYTMGLQNPIDFSPDRWRITLAVLQLLPDCALMAKKEFPDGLEIEDNVTGRFPKLRFLSAEASARVMDLLSDKICNVGLHGLPVAGMSARFRRFIYNHIRDPKPSEETIAFVNGGELRSTFDEVVKRTMLLLRGLIAKGILHFAFASKRWRVNYGPDHSRRPETKLAVPYRAKDCPSSRSEFSHPDVVIVLSSIHYYYAGLSTSELFLCLEHVLRSDQAPAEYAAWTQTAPSLPAAFKEIIGVNIKDRQQCLEVLFPHLRQATGVINYYLQHIVFPKEMREFPHKMSASGWDIGENKTLGTTGFSGTNDSRYLLPLSVEQLDLPKQQHTNALVLSYLLRDESEVQLLPQKDFQVSDAEHLLRCIICGATNIRVILDVGAQILELNNRQVAELWLNMDTNMEQTKGAIFVDDKDEICVVDRQGHVEPLQSSPFLGQMDLCLVYLDEAHTRGIDLRLP